MFKKHGVNSLISMGKWINKVLFGGVPASQTKSATVSGGRKYYLVGVSCEVGEVKCVLSDFYPSRSLQEKRVR